jgi:hypothetical protein
MRWATLAILVACGACGGDAHVFDPNAPNTFSFGPYTIQPSQEISDQCVQITLDNEQTVYINSVELDTGPGFHHSNWFFFPGAAPGVAPLFDGPDGTFTCADRGLDPSSLQIEVGAGTRGGVLFAQSTQSQHDVQAFPPGAAVEIPRHYKLIASIHLLNPSDAAVTVTPTITLTPILEADVTTRLAGLSFENHALGLPPNARSRFSIDCDLDPAHQNPPATWPLPDFKMYFGLAHYHKLGTGLTIEAVRPDDTATTVFSTNGAIGDALGATITPAFDWTGYTRLRMSCDYTNTTASTVVWGIGDQEMCVFLGFTDSIYQLTGGALLDDPPGPGTDVNGVMSYSHACSVFEIELSTQ